MKSISKFKAMAASLALAATLCFTAVAGIDFSHAGAASANTYYISSSEGSDAADGLTPDTAWKSFANINAKKLEAGEKVLLKRGDTFTERLEILGQGTQDNWIELSAYGEGEKPCIRLNNDNDDIAVLLKDFYGDANGDVVLSPIQYVRINNLKIEDTRLGIFVRIYATENQSNPSLRSHHVEVTDCEFENITCGVLPELNAAVDAEESKWDGFSPIASSSIMAVYNAKITELHGSPKGNLPKIEAGKYVAEGGGGFEYIFPCAVMVGGKKSTVTDENASSAVPALQYFKVQRVELRDCVAGVMAWFYNWNGQSANAPNKFRSNVQYVTFEDILATGVAPSTIGIEGCDGGATLVQDHMEVGQDGWGHIKNVRVVRGTLDKGQNIPLGTTDVIVEKSKNFLIEECEFLGMTNHNNCDGVGFDFEGNNSNIELKNSVFAYNDGGAILIMDNGSGGHSNLFIRNNLMYNDLQNAYDRYNNRNNNYNYHYIEFSNRNNSNVVIENNTVRHQRETTTGRTIEFIGQAEEGASTYTLRNNSVGCYESGTGFKEFTTYFEGITGAGGKIVLPDAALHTKRYNAMWLNVRGEKSYRGTILGKSAGGNSSAEPVAFESDNGYVDLAALEGLNWNIPFTQVEITLEGVKEGKTVSVEFVPNTGAEYTMVEGNKVEVRLTGQAGSVFKADLSADDFRLMNLVTRKKITDAQRLSFTRALVTLDGNLTATEQNYLSLRFFDILPSAYETNVQKAFSAIDVNATRNEKSVFFAQKIELLSRPEKTEYKTGETFDTTGARAKVTFADGTSTEVEGNKLSVSRFDSSKEGSCTVALSYGNAVAYVNVSIEKGQSGAQEQPSGGGCAGSGMSAGVLAGAVLIAGVATVAACKKKGV